MDPICQVDRSEYRLVRLNLHWISIHRSHPPWIHKLREDQAARTFCCYLDPIRGPFSNCDLFIRAINECPGQHVSQAIDKGVIKTIDKIQTVNVQLKF